MAFSDTVGIASLYLALLGLLSTFFFIHLGTWLAEISGMKAKTDFLTTKPKAEYTSEKLEAFYVSSGHSSFWILFGWVIVTGFMGIIVTFLEILRRSLPTAQADTMWRFVAVPGLIFLAIFLVASIFMLVRGYLVASDNKKRLREKI